MLAGGASTRLGTDKTRVQVGGRTVLDRVLEAVAGAGRRIVVGDERRVAVPVIWTRERPVGSGPAAGVVAAVGLVRAPRVVVLAADTPYVTAATIARLLAALPGVQAARLVDPEGHGQHLVAAVTTESLRQVAALRATWADAAMHELWQPLHIASVLAEPGETGDLDTADDLTAFKTRHDT